MVSHEVPLNAATSGGAVVTISGLNFGVYGFTPTVLAVADVEDCGTTSWSSATTAQCLLSTPTTFPSSYSKVVVGAVVGTKALSVFTFDGMCRPFGVGDGDAACMGVMVGVVQGGPRQGNGGFRVGVVWCGLGLGLLLRVGCAQLAELWCPRLQRWP